MRPERRLKPGVDGGLRAGLLVSPLHHLKTAERACNRILVAGGSQVLVVGFVIPESPALRSSVRADGQAPLAQMPGFPAGAQGADLGSGNQVTVARHGRFVTEPPPPANNPLLHRP
jgi:hypothetical protein